MYTTAAYCTGSATKGDRMAEMPIPIITSHPTSWQASRVPKSLSSFVCEWGESLGRSLVGHATIPEKRFAECQAPQSKTKGALVGHRIIDRSTQASVRTAFQPCD
jgi:hypothetical protein